MGAVLLAFCFVSCKKDKSCATMNYTYSLPNDLNQEVDYIKLYASEDDFATGERGVGAVDSMGAPYLILNAQVQVTPFLDIRYADGTNSWSNQAELSQLGETSFSSTNCETKINFSDYAALKNVVRSSPVYMHLVLAEASQDGGSKSWLVDKIYDEDEFDVSNRPEWQCVKQLGFTFFKGGKGAKVKITIPPAAGICTMYEELFQGKTEAFATYSLEGDDQQELRITVPAVSDRLKEQLTFSVIESAYDHLRISLTNGNAQVGYAVLIPANHE